MSLSSLKDSEHIGQVNFGILHMELFLFGSEEVELEG